MSKTKNIAILSLAALFGMGTAHAAPKKQVSTEPEMAKAVREQLERLPYYGVFDVLQYQVSENGAVELSGFAFRDSLKKEAEEAVARVPGVKSVVNRIEDLEWGVLDDEIRAKVYLTIYRDSVLSRYGTSTDMALANGIGLAPGGRFGVFGPIGIGNPYLPGFNPSGDYGIRIIVSRGEVILMGTVDNSGDKALAGLKARGVFPARKVFNELTVRGEEPEVPEAPAKPAKRGTVTDADSL